MVYFVLNEVIWQRCPVGKSEGFGEAAIESHFFFEPPVSGIYYRISRPRMAAAGIGPQAAE